MKIFSTKVLLEITQKESLILKGLAILTVIQTHATGKCGDIFNDIPVLGNINFTSMMVGVGMWLFLFLSGYGLYVSYENNGLIGFWKKKFVKIWIPYFIVQVFWIVYFYFGNDGEIYPLKTLLIQLLGISPTNTYDNSMWYISYILFWNLAFFIAFRLFKKKEYAIIALVVITIISAFYITSYWSQPKYCIFPFTIGVIYAYFRKRKISWLMVFGVVVVGYGAHYFINHSALERTLLVENLEGFCIMFATLFAEKCLVRVYSFPILSFLGQISYYLYLLEMRTIIKNPLFYHFGYKMWIYIGAFIVTVAVCYVGDRIYTYLLTKVFKREEKVSIKQNE